MNNYLKDKKGWVTFKNKKQKKVKLRTHISLLAQDLASINNKSYDFNRDLLIENYNKDGLKGVSNCYRAILLKNYEEKLAKLKEQEKQLKDENENKTIDSGEAL